MYLILNTSYKKIMNTLYISDLDGTLLHPDIKISKKSIEILNGLIDKGMNFTVATARSIASVKHILSQLKTTVPVIMMNGVCIYDFIKRDYIKIETLSQDSIQQLMKLIREHHLKGFAYVIKDGVMSTYYEELSSKAMYDFYQERIDLYQKRFTQIDDFTRLVNVPLIYFSLLDQYERLEPIYHKLLALPDLNCVFYKDNYSVDQWYLETYSQNASKYHAVQYLRSSLNIDRIICFGDNRNDLPLFEACDYKLAVGNAVSELKEKADQVISCNYEDGVALWLQQNVSFD
jgi:Cof subfamily protein (haloacid dehalogenase superfamily)